MSYVFDSEHKTCASIDQVNRIRGILAQANIKFQLIKVDPPVDFHITKYLKESQTVQTNAEFAYPQVVLNGYTIGNCEALVSLAANGELPRIMKLQQNPTQHLKDLINTSYLQPFSQRQKEREQAEQKQAQRQDLVRRDAQPQAFGPEIVQDQNQAEQLRLKELAAETDRIETTLPLDVKQNVETLVPVFPNLFRKTLMIVCQQLRGRELDYIIDYIVANSERLESEQPKFPSLLANKSPAELESEPIVELHEIPKPVKLEKPKSDPVADQSLALIEQNARLTEENKNLSNQLRHLRSEQELSLKIMQEKLVAQIRAQEALQQQLQQQMQAVGAAKAANEALLTALNQQLTVMQ